MAQHERRIDRILAPEYVADLDARDLDDLRAMRREAVEVETEVSYVRRLAQGRIEIVRAEVDRRRDGGTLSDLIARLPEILADQGPRPAAANARVPEILAPSMSITWSRGAERLIADDTLANLPTLSEDELTASLDALRALEQEVSGTRRQLHGVIDAIDAVLGPRLADAET
ncbi:MAG: aerial mycelium formation protein [Actinomycetes bacterium]